MVWAELHERHEALRDLGSCNVGNELRKRVRTMADRGWCEEGLVGRLTDKNNGDNGLVATLVTGGDKFGAPIELELPGLRRAVLHLYVLHDGRKKRLLKFTVRLEVVWPAVADGPERPMLLSIEFDDKTMGSGACGHPLLHAHVGHDHDHKPQLRLPVAAMRPWDAVDWLICQVDPSYEPSPWAEVAVLPSRPSARR